MTQKSKNRKNLLEGFLQKLGWKDAGGGIFSSLESIMKFVRSEYKKENIIYFMKEFDGRALLKIYSKSLK